MAARKKGKRSKNLYVLRGYEWEVASLVVVTRFSITELGSAIPSETTLRAAGRIWLRDYPEDHRWQCAWEALCDVRPDPEIIVPGEVENEYQRWYRTHKQREYPMLWRVWGKEGGAYRDFTAAEDVNRGLTAFVGSHLCFYCLGIGNSGQLPQIHWEPQRYQGPLAAYSDICLCAALARSDRQTPFPWQAVTNGKFPNRCFQCSCTKRWWNINPAEHRWVPIGDQSTWERLTRYNGEPTQLLCWYNEAIHLLGPLVHRGVTPIYLPPPEHQPRIIIST